MSRTRPPVFRLPAPPSAAEPAVGGGGRPEPADALVPVVSVEGMRAMVASPHHLASQAGMEMLRSGGSAADAALATNLVLSVAYPDMCGVGGDLFALVWPPGATRPECLDASGTGGRRHERATYLARTPSGPPLYGPGSVTVPGAPAGWLELHRRFGRRPLAEVFAPAIELARSGLPCPARLIASFERWGPAVAVVQFDGGARTPSARMRMPGYANTLDRLASAGLDGLWAEIADPISRATQGLLDLTDLSGYEPRWVSPLHGRVFGREWWTAPPPSQGYLALLAGEILQLVDPHCVEAPIDDPRVWHHMVEAIKLASFDRDEVLGDRPGPPASFRRARERAERVTDVASPFRSPAESGDTVYLCAVDSDGMGVSLVQSLFHPWGSRVQLPEHGVILQNRGSSFDIRPGHVNEVGPGRRPRSTLSPTVISADGRLVGLLGTMGGDVQPQVVLQLNRQLSDRGRTPADVLAAPRFFIHRGLAPSIWSGEEPVVGLESRVPADVVEDLARRGHPVHTGGPFVELAGHAQAIDIDPISGLLRGAADPRAGSGGVAAW